MKSILKQCVGWLLSCVFGVIGAYAYTHWRAAETEKVPLLRASRFELTDSTGRVVAFWGTDRGKNTVLAFLQESTQDAGPEVYKGPPFQTAFTSQSPNEAIAFGMMSTQEPFVNVLGRNGSSRAMLYLGDYQKPVFMMSDESYEGRLVLGFIGNDAPSPKDDDWGLLFRGPSVAGIGSTKDPVHGKYRGYLSADRTPKSK